MTSSGDDIEWEEDDSLCGQTHDAVLLAAPTDPLTVACVLQAGHKGRHVSEPIAISWGSDE